MQFDYDAFVADLKNRKAIPLIVLFGVPDSTGVNLDWFSTSAYDNADDTLKADANSALERVSTQING